MKAIKVIANRAETMGGFYFERTDEEILPFDSDESKKRDNDKKKVSDVLSGVVGVVDVSYYKLKGEIVYDVSVAGDFEEGDLLKTFGKVSEGKILGSSVFMVPDENIRFSCCSL